MTTPERAAAPLVQNSLARRPDAPGQFAFADQSRIRRILEESGWTEIDIRPIDIVCTFPENELTRYLMWVGPIGRIIQEADDRTRTQVVEKVRAALDSYVHGAEVRFIAAGWMASARAPSA